MSNGVEVMRIGADPTDAEVVELLDLAQIIEDESFPNDPRLSHAELAGELRHPLPAHYSATWLARLDGTVVGRLAALMDQRPMNAGFVQLEAIEVHPQRRRRGIATELMRVAMGELVGHGARTVMTWSWTPPGGAFCERSGFTLRQEERKSRLLVEDVDFAQQDEWIAAPRAREAGYRVVSWSGFTPDEHLTAWAVACDAMADAPLDAVEWTHDPATPEWIRALEAVKDARGEVRYASLALSHDGEPAGMTLVLLHPDRPGIAHQEDTAVVSAHRGYGLGRWLKAANLRQLVAAHPDVAIVDTWNAESNGPMLDINVAMGFRPLSTYFAYQGPVADVVGRVEAG
jgi:mycothiol synthase